MNASPPISRSTVALPAVVLDTNIWLDLLLFRDSACAALAEAITQRRLRVVSSIACLDELTEVLRYPRIASRFTHAQDAARQAQAIAEPIDTKPWRAPLPQCRDADDQPFLELALDADAAVLITKDKHLLELARRIAAFRILAPGPALNAWLNQL